MPTLTDRLATRCGTLCVLVALCLAGCEQIEGLIDDSAQETQTTNAAPQPPAQQNQPLRPAAPPQQQNQAPVDPNQLVANLQSVNANMIQDGDLKSVADVPDAASQITSLSLKNNSRITPGAISHLAKLPNLQSLDMSGSGLKSGDYTGLQQVTGLKELKLKNTQISDAGLTSVTQINSLQSLDISGTLVSYNSLQGLDNLPALEDVDVSMNRNVNDDVVAILVKKPLRSVSVAGTSITDASLEMLAGVSTLENLNVGLCNVTGRAFRHFNKTGLKSLNAGETKFGVDGLNAIKGMKALERLELYHAGVVQHNSVKTVFTSLPSLTYLNVAKNSITDAGIPIFFGRMKKLEYLNLGQHSTVTNQGLAGLVTVKTLKTLDVSGTGVTAQGIGALQARLPEVNVISDR